MKVDIFNVEQWEKPTNIDDAIKMIRKIKRMFPIAGIIWQPEDVVIYGRDHDPEIRVPDYIAIEVIEHMEHNKDCNLGLTWDTLDDFLKQELSAALGS